MKVLLYTVFKDLTTAGVVTRVLVNQSSLRTLVPNRTLHSVVISLKTPCEWKRLRWLMSGNGHIREVERKRRTSDEVHSLKAEQCSLYRDPH